MAVPTRGVLHPINNIALRVTGVGTGLTQGHPSLLYALHNQAHSHAIKKVVYKNKPFNLVAARNTQTLVERKGCHPKDAQIDTWASLPANTQAVNYIRGGYAAAIDNAGRPTESEEDVVADRTDEDPLPPMNHHTIRLPPGEAAPTPTESEADVAADRSDNDPLSLGRHRTEE